MIVITNVEQNADLCAIGILCEFKGESNTHIETSFPHTRCSLNLLYSK